MFKFDQLCVYAGLRDCVKVPETLHSRCIVFFHVTAIRYIERGEVPEI